MEKEFERKSGDMVWVMHENKAVCGCIKSIFFCQGISCVDFRTIDGNEEYTVFVGDKSIGSFKLKDIFSTKEELIESLKK